MSDDNQNGIIIQSPIKELRKEIQSLKEKVRNLERDREQRIKVELILLERYEEARALYIQGMELFKSVKQKDENS